MKVFFSSVVVLVLQAYAYSQDYKAINISLAEGLSQSSVYTISQDRSGFVWFGTQDGLNKYDGVRFQTWYNEPFDSNSLSSANILSLYHDKNDRMWIGTVNGGLNIFLPAIKKFINPEIRIDPSLPVNHLGIGVIKEDKDGNAWIGTTHGLYKATLDGESEEIPAISFQRVFCDTGLQGSCIITCLVSDKSKSLWAGTRNGLFHLEFTDPRNPVITPFRTENGLGSNEILSLACDSRGQVWAGTPKGIAVFNHQEKNFRSFLIAENKSASGQNSIYTLCAASNGSVWIGTYNGLFCIDKKSADAVLTRIPEFKSIIPESKYLSSGIISIAEDNISKGLMWVGTEAQGVVKVVPLQKKFYTNHMREIMPLAFVFSIMPDDNDLLWVGTTSGLVRYNRKTEKFSIYKSESGSDESLWSNSINSIKKDEFGTIWIGTPAGLHRISNPYSGKPGFKHVVINPGLPAAPIRHLYLDNNKNLFVVLPSRVFKYELTSNKCTELVVAGDSLADNKSGFVFSSFLVDSRENIWLTTNSGLLLYRKQSHGYDFAHPEKYFHIISDTTSLRCNTINDVMEDKTGRIWLATFNGLTKAEIRADKVHFTNYSTENGMKNNAVYGVLESSDGTLWMSTNGGLTKFEPAGNGFRNYDLNDGLQSNEFDAGAYFRSENNEMFFGGVNGYTSFFPEQIQSDQVPPRLVITSFELNENDATTPPSMPSGGSIDLNYSQNSFSIEFVALHFADPAKNQYAYMLEGFQKEWTQSGTSNRVNFSQLPPGKYKFKVKGSNSDGLFNEAGTSLTISIRSPFWETPWFYLTIAVLVAIFFWLVHLYRLRLKMQQLREIEQIRKETAADFHDELGHKLTTISWFGEILKKKISPDEKELRSHIEKITETSGNLYHTMKDLVWAMDPGKDSLSDLYNQLKEFGESLFDQTGVEFTAKEVNGELKDKTISLAQKRHVLLIFKETMHNSFKHSHGSQVYLGIVQENNHFTLTMKDNGKGFLFDWKDTGNGLKNVRKRTELIHGKILINSDENGTLVELEVPLGEN